MVARGVLFVIGSMGGGGAERQVVEILKRLDRSRFRPVLYLAHRTGELLSEVPADVPVYSFWEGFAGTLRSKVHHLLGTTDKARWRDMARIMRRERIELVYDRIYLSTLDATAACQLARLPRISVCDGNPLEAVKLYAGNSQRSALQTATRAYATASRVVAVSQGMKERLIEDLAVPGNNIEVLYNLIDLDETDRMSGEFDPKFAPDRIHLLTVARMSEEKGLRHLIEALERLVHQRGHRELLWHLLGSGPLENELKGEVHRRGLNDHVDFVGFAKNPFPYYRHADLFCLSSLHEGLSCVLIEALACSLPALSTDCVAGPREVLAGGRWGRLVPPADPDSYANAIEDYLSHREDWRRQAAQARQFVEQTFAIEPGLRRLEQLFDEAIQTYSATTRTAEHARDQP